jgi:hypothetical protein
MATRSTIALEFADGTVGQIYCHWDGYISNNGKILFDHYQDPFKVRELIDLGDLSSLGSVIGEKQDFNQPAKDTCVFYGRDRGESGVEARLFQNFDDYVQNHQYEEFEYILRTDGRWYVSDHDGEFVTLAEALVKAQVPA